MPKKQVCFKIRHETHGKLKEFCDKKLLWNQSLFVDLAIEEKLSRELCITNPENRVTRLKRKPVITTKKVTTEICMYCDGTGWLEIGSALRTHCTKCNGVGEVTVPVDA